MRSAPSSRGNEDLRIRFQSQKPCLVSALSVCCQPHSALTFMPAPSALGYLKDRSDSDAEDPAETAHAQEQHAQSWSAEATTNRFAVLMALSHACG